MYKNIGTDTRSAGLQDVVVTGTILNGTDQYPPSAASYVRNIYLTPFLRKPTKMSPLYFICRGAQRTW